MISSFLPFHNNNEMDSVDDNQSENNTYGKTHSGVNSISGKSSNITLLLTRLRDKKLNGKINQLSANHEEVIFQSLPTVRRHMEGKT